MVELGIWVENRVSGHLLHALSHGACQSHHSILKSLNFNDLQDY
jgi:hypothetical protein